MPSFYLHSCCLGGDCENNGVRVVAYIPKAHKIKCDPTAETFDTPGGEPVETNTLEKQDSHTVPWPPEDPKPCYVYQRDFGYFKYLVKVQVKFDGVPIPSYRSETINDVINNGACP